MRGEEEAKWRCRGQCRSDPTRSARGRFALGVFLAALGVRFALVGAIPTGVAFASSFRRSILVAYFSGLWPAIATVAASTLAGWYFFLSPTLVIDDAGDWAITFVPFLAICAIRHRASSSSSARRSTSWIAERAKSAALAEQREVLFRELQHRVSNNLAIVSALLNLERAEVTDEKARQALTRGVDPPRADRQDPSQAARPGRRAAPLRAVRGRSLPRRAQGRRRAAISSASSRPPTRIPSDKLVPVALIVTELISNALEHGFAGRTNGTIRIDLTPEGTDHVLTIADDGNGLPPDFSLEARGGIGLRIVQSLAQQIDGRFAMESGGGTTCRVIFQSSSLAA